MRLLAFTLPFFPYLCAWTETIKTERGKHSHSVARRRTAGEKFPLYSDHYTCYYCQIKKTKTFRDVDVLLRAGSDMLPGEGHRKLPFPSGVVFLKFRQICASVP